jgi:class 3 adenylate cyclase/tetratricopeptide (TPR) repeat protein
MICPNCAAANVAGAKFCNECGTALVAGCPRCGATNTPGAKFCNECGTALRPAASTAVSEPARATPVAERRLVTVVFADLVGFTPFAEERDAEEVRDTLSRYFDMCSDIVARYGGTIEKFIGDAVMAVWGAPVAHEDDAERAVRAALELIDSVGGLSHDTQARAGVLTGEAAVTMGATNQGMVAGDLVNTAARLQAAAAAGSVLVGEATFRAASEGVQFEPAGEQTLKGKQSPVPAWRALRVVAELGGRNRREALEAPFVGRAEELRLLKELFHATAREGRTRLVSVMGPAGIGKSRLAWEFSKYTDGLVEDTYWHVGRSPAYGEGITFWALGEMIRRRCGLVEGDDEPTTREKVSETVSRWLTDPDEREWIERALLTLLGVEAGMSADQLFGAWRTFFERIAAAGTVALIFEDLHHADSGLLDFIDHILEWSRGVPIYIVTLARPELLDGRPDWGAGKRSFTSIHLEPLPEPEMRDLLAGLVPGLSEETVARIVERADGMPLYAVETVRMLISQGRLRQEGDVYVPAADLSTLSVPETLTALIASRLDGLEPADRSLLHDAAVLGQSFTLAALAALSGLDEAILDERLKVLARREILARDVDPRSPERGHYAFVQALIREVGYNTLSRRERKARHLSAARYFEQLGSDELASALANHYLAAHHNAAEGAEADALAAQARIALRAAAERAASLGAHDQAVTFLEQAVTVTADPSEQAELFEKAGEEASIAGRYEKAEELCRRAIELYAAAGDRLGAARATAGLGRTLLNARRNVVALELLDRADEEYRDLWPHPASLLLKVSLARACNQAEQHPRALQLADETLAAAERADLLPIVADAFVSKGMALGGLGRQREAIALINAGEDLARANGFDETLLAALIVGGFTVGEIDNEVGLGKYREGLAYARRTGRRGIMLQFVNNFGYTAFLVGEWDGGLAEMEAALAEELDLGQRVWLLSNALIIRVCRGESITDGIAELERLAAVHGDPELILPILDTKANDALAAGRLDEAADQWRRGVEGEGNITYAPQSYYQAARPALWTGKLEQVVADLAAIDATGVHGRVAEARRVTLRAGIAALEGRAAEGVALYREAVRAWHDLGMVWDEALTGIDMATVLDPGDQHVRATARSTREILERLGARPFIERLDQALARTSETPVVPEPVSGSAAAVSAERG